MQIYFPFFRTFGPREPGGDKSSAKARGETEPKMVSIIPKRTTHILMSNDVLIRLRPETGQKRNDFDFGGDKFSDAGNRRSKTVLSFGGRTQLGSQSDICLMPNDDWNIIDAARCLAAAVRARRSALAADHYRKCQRPARQSLNRCQQFHSTNSYSIAAADCVYSHFLLPLDRRTQIPSR